MPKTLQDSLLDWFRADARDLPWRRTRDPYAVWLAEIILQQTRIDQGLPYYERFIEAYPSVTALAAAPLDAVMKLWEGLGYYSRARNLHRAAKMVVNEYGGRFPYTAAALKKLPGVGDYTAGAIASIAFGQREPVVDGNVKRVLARLYAVAESIDSAPTTRRLWEIAWELVPAEAPGDFNQALMELGARVCAPRNPMCGECPARRWCRAREEGAQDALPVRTAKKAAPHQERIVAVIERRGRLLIGRRPPNGLLGGLWEFPNGEISPGESHEAALVRTARETAGLAITPEGCIAAVDHAYTHLRVTLHVYRCSAHPGKPEAGGGHTALKWVFPSQFDRYAFPGAHHKFLARLARPE